MKTVLVLCGGRSAEREVSCVSAAAVLNNIPKGWKAELVWIDPAGRWHLQSSPKGLAASKAIVADLRAGRPAAEAEAYAAALRQDEAAKARIAAFIARGKKGGA